MTELSSEVYAVILARVAHRGLGHLDEILRELGVTVEDLRRGEPAILSQLACAWPKRAGKNAMKFATALAEELGRLGALASSGDGPRPPSVSSVAPEMAIPSFLQPAPLPISAPMPPRPIIPEALPEPPTAVHRPPAHLAGTMDADLSAIAAAVGRGTLPFSAPTATPADTQALPGAAPPSGQGRPQGRPYASLTGTVEADSSIFAPPTPFAPPPPPPAPPAPGELDLKKYPLEVYAAVVGTLARGEVREQVLANFRLTEPLYEQLAHAWGARFEKEPQLHVQFKVLARNSATAAPRKAGQ